MIDTCSCSSASYSDGMYTDSDGFLPADWTLLHLVHVWGEDHE